MRKPEAKPIYKADYEEATPGVGRLGPGMAPCLWAPPAAQPAFLPGKVGVSAEVRLA